MTGTDLHPDPGGEDHPLDHVIWNALSGPDAHFAQGGPLALRYDPAVAPFAALARPDAAGFAALLPLLGPGIRAALFTVAELSLPETLTIERRALVEQMVLAQLSPFETPELEALGPESLAEMQELVAVTQPGPFGPRTIEFGGYLGIRRAGRLVAMAGERMRIPGYTEVSAVCVHPDWRGHGFAAAVVSSVAKRILARGERPFLHVFKGNDPAIALYEKLGFHHRRRLHLAAVRAAAHDPAAQ